MTDGVSAFVRYFQGVPAEISGTEQEFDGMFTPMRERIAAGDSDDQIAQDAFEGMAITHPEGAPTGGQKSLFIMGLAEVINGLREGHLK